MTVKAFEEDAGHEFYKWLYTEIGKDNVDQFSPTELAELAYREAARTYGKRMFDMSRVLAHPDLHVIAGVLSAPVTSLKSPTKPAA